MSLPLHQRPVSRWGRHHFIGATASLGLLLGATSANAQTLYGLGTLTAAQAGQPVGAQAFIPISPGNGAPTGSYAFVTGLTTATQKLVGFDYRPNTGEAFVLGYDASVAAPGVNAQLYTVVPTTGALTAVGAAMRLNLGGATDRIGFDFNPTVDRIRVVSTNDANYRLNPNNGAVAATDGNLNYASGTPANPSVGAVAYTNSYRASSNTTLYDFDEVAGILSTQNPPNNGTLVDQKQVRFGTGFVSSPVAIDLDISSYTTPGTEEAFVTEVTTANGSGFSSSNLYSINLATGQATLRGNTIPAFASSPFNVEDIAVSIPAPAALPALTGQLVYGVTVSGNLITFDSNNPGVIRTVMGITGLTTGQTLVGTDFRPNTGQLFGLGYDGSTLPAGTPNAQLYTINTGTGAATAVGTGIQLGLGGVSDEIGFDFNPTVDRIRVVSTNDANYRLNPNTGGIVAGANPVNGGDLNLNYAAGDAGAGQNPNVGTVAYTNSYVGATSTGLFTLDPFLSLVSFQNPPNDGVLTNSRALTGVNGGGAIAPINDLDVYYNGTTNVPYLVAAAGVSPNTSRFFTLNALDGTTTTGQVATEIGQIGALPISVRDISIPLSAASVVAVNPGTVTGQLLYAVAGGNLISFDSNAPGVIRSAVNFGAGLTAGQTVVGTDFRPATGQLYALGYNPALTGTTANAQLYTVSLTTGALTAVGTAIRLELGTGATAGTLPLVGFDFNPTVDRIRVISANSGTGISNNYRLNPITGAVAFTDTNLNGQAGAYSATAYTNSQSNANTTAQFVFDSGTGAITQVTNPNGGVVSGPSYSITGTSTTTGGDFDIYNTPGTTTNQGFIATAASAATANDNLYVVGDFGSPFNLSVTNAGLIGQGSNVSGLAAFIMAGTGITWNGSVSTDWGTAANWTPAQVPTANSDVTIPSGTPNQPTVSSAQQARLVTLTTGAVLTLANGGTLTAGGSFTNNGGSVAGGGTGTLVLGGTAPVIGGTSLSAFPNLTANSAASTAAPVAVQRALTLNNTLTIGTGQGFTLLSSASGTAYVVNNGSAVLSGTATVQRYIDGSLNSGAGYHHYSAPVAGSTVADLATAGFSPTVNPAYNTSATPATVTPFPTVYAYDQSRLASTSNNLPVFDKGFVSPAATTDALNVGQGYTVNIGASQLVDFVGTLNNSTVTANLARNTGATAADAGWALLGNPYPAPLDYSLVAPADRTNLDAAIYVYQSTGQYVGQYRAYTNGMGGNPVLPVAQGFFARVSSGQTNGSLTFRNSQRLTTDNGTTFQRPTADLRPQVQLELRGSTGPADAFYAYAESGATPAFDSQYDAAKLPNPNGLNLAGAAASGEAVAIDGRPAFTAATVLPLTVSVPAAGTYSLRAAALSNLPTGLDAYLADDLTGQTLKLSAGTSYSFSATAAQAAAPITGRFRLYFRPNAPLATAPSLSADVVGVYPNPAHERFTVTLPGLSQATTVQAELLNNLGQVVRRQQAALPTSGTQFTLEAGDLATGVYTLRLQAGTSTLAKRIVIQ